MQKLKVKFIIGFILFLLAGCATLEDVQRSTDLIRTDNELTRILVDVRPNDQILAGTDLAVLANHAKNKANALKDDRGKILDAIAYYRIAATAYWRSGKSEVTGDLFEATNNGTDLCAKLGEKAPDRDCLFLQLVIPFAGLESLANETGLSGLLADIDFNDGNATDPEIQTMAKIRGTLNQAKGLVKKILTVGEENRLLSHPGIREYYCDNAKKAFKEPLKNYSEKFTNYPHSL